MTRIFFWVAAIAAALFGLLMFFSPATAAQAFGVTLVPLGEALFRLLGGTLLGVAVLNVMVAGHPRSPTLNAIIWGDVAIHVFGAAADIWSATSGSLTWGSIGAGMVVHVIIVALGLFVVIRP
jgi:hypothetical protein